MEIQVRKPTLRIVREYVHNKVRLPSDIFEGEVPEEIMGFADSVRGDGHARVSVTDNSMGVKDFGNGPSVSVTISIDCNQDDATMATAIRTIGQWTRFFAREQFEQAKIEYQKMIDEQKQIHVPAGYSGPPTFKP